MLHLQLLSTVRGFARQGWRDLLSVYYANTPAWRWLKSAALVFLGFFLWMGGLALLSVEPGWTFLHYAMAYGLLVIFWGPFTHFVVVPMTIRLRRNATSDAARWLSRNSGKVNLAIFFSLVIVIGTIAPSFMLLEFSPSLPGGDSADVSGELVCETGAEQVTCHVENPQGIHRVVARSGDQQLAVAEEPPFRFEVDRDEVTETRAGEEFVVEFQDEDGSTLQRFVQRV